MRFERGGITATAPLSMIDLRKLIGVVCTICNHMLTLHTGYELLCLCDIVLLACGQREPQGIAKTIHTHMDLRGEPASASTNRL